MLHLRIPGMVISRIRRARIAAKRETNSDSYTLNRVTEVTGKFSVRGSEAEAPETTRLPQVGSRAARFAMMHNNSRPIW